MTTHGLCAQCNAGPAGVEGHPQLAMQVPLTGQPQQKTSFRCATCEAEWTRSYAGGGNFSWEVVEIPSN